MASSPLTAAMLSGGNNGLAPLISGTDPAQLAAMPQLSLAQEMIKAGLDTSAAYPMQALARVAQSAAGQYAQSNAIKTLAQMYAANADDLSKALPANHPLQEALHSPNIAVRMMAVNEAGKAFTQLGEIQKSSPGENFTYGTGATISQNTRPRSPLGVEGEDIANNGRLYPPAGGPGPAPGAGAPSPAAAPPGAPGPAPQGGPVPAGGMIAPGESIIGGGPAAPGAPSPGGPAPAPAPIPVSAAPPPAPAIGKTAFNDRFTGDHAPVAGAAPSPVERAIGLAAQAKGAQEGASEKAKGNEAFLGKLTEGGLTAQTNSAMAQKLVELSHQLGSGGAMRGLQLMAAEHGIHFGDKSTELELFHALAAHLIPAEGSLASTRLNPAYLDLLKQGSSSALQDEPTRNGVAQNLAMAWDMQSRAGRIAIDDLHFPTTTHKLHAIYDLKPNFNTLQVPGGAPGAQPAPTSAPAAPRYSTEQVEAAKAEIQRRMKAGGNKPVEAGMSPQNVIPAISP